MTTELSNFAARLREFIHSPKASSATFDEMALELFALQFEHNAPYRRLCEARGAAPRSVTHWAEVPTVPTAAFKELELTCLPVPERTTVFHSSGTTEQRPSRHFHSMESLAVYEASLLPWFKRHMAPDFGFRISNFEFAVLTPPPTRAPHSSLVHMFETVRREFDLAGSVFVGRVLSDGGWCLDLDAALRILHEASAAKRPLALLGTAFSFVHLLDDLAERELRFPLPAGSRVMETGGYKGRSRSLPKTELHDLISQRLGIPPTHIVCEYGMSELSSQGYDTTVECDGIVRPHPGPLPQERENCRQSVGESGVVGNVGARALLFPLPTGEGQGEGKSVVEIKDRVFHFPPWVQAQIISPETGREVGEGETGLIRVFDLANVFSVLAIQTEDLGIRRGDGFELIGRAALAESRGCSLMAV